MRGAGGVRGIAGGLRANLGGGHAYQVDTFYYSRGQRAGTRDEEDYDVAMPSANDTPVQLLCSQM